MRDLVLELSMFKSDAHLKSSQKSVREIYFFYQPNHFKQNTCRTREITVKMMIVVVESNIKIMIAKFKCMKIQNTVIDQSFPIIFSNMGKRYQNLYSLGSSQFFSKLRRELCAKIFIKVFFYSKFLRKINNVQIQRME